MYERASYTYVFVRNRALYYESHTDSYESQRVAAMLSSMSTASSMVMKEKIKQAQDARRQRLRARLEDIATTGSSVSPATSPGRGVTEVPQLGITGVHSPKTGLHVRFPDPEAGALGDSDAQIIEPYAATPIPGDGAWGGLRLDIASLPEAAGTIANRASQEQRPTEESGHRCATDCSEIDLQVCI